MCELALSPGGSERTHWVFVTKAVVLLVSVLITAVQQAGSVINGAYDLPHSFIHLCVTKSVSKT